MITQDDEFSVQCSPTPSELLLLGDDNMDINVDANLVNNLLGPSVSNQQVVPGPGTCAEVQGGVAQKTPQHRPNKCQRAKFRSVSAAKGPSTQAGSSTASTRSSSQTASKRGRSVSQVPTSSGGWQGNGRSFVPAHVKPHNVFNRHIPVNVSGARVMPQNVCGEGS